MGEVDAVLLDKCLLVCSVGAPDLLEERVAGGDQEIDVDELLGDLVEVALDALDGGPLGGPSAQVTTAVVGRSEDLVEVLEEEQRLS